MQQGKAVDGGSPFAPNVEQSHIFRFEFLTE
jgi:hypothetical protein